MIGISRNFRGRFWVPLILLPVLSACAHLHPGAESAQPAEAAPQPPAGQLESITPQPRVSLPDEQLTANELYRILLGEIAGQRGRMDVAVPAYLEAAKKSKDPRIAERAVKIAVYGQAPEQAYEAANRWVELAPEDLEAHQAVAALALRKGDESAALQELNYLIDKSPQPREGYQAVLGLLAREADQERARAVMEKIVGQRDTDGDAHYTYAQLALHEQNWELALREARRTLALEPGRSDAVILQAQAQLKLGNAEEAHKGITEALDADPDDVELRKAYARLLVDQGDLDGARKQYEWLIKRQPDDGPIVYSLALLTLEANRLKDAERYFNRLLELEYQVQPAYYYLGAIAEENKDYDKAVEWYDKVEPGDHWLEVQIRLAKIEADTGNLPAARARLKNLRLTDPAHAERLILIEGDLLVSVHHEADAYALYTEFLAAHSDNLEVLYARSLVAESLDKLDVAEQDLRLILRKEPDNARALNALGYTLADRTTRYQEALGYIEKAYAQTPDDAAVIDSMGWVQYRLGNLDKAREYLQKAHEANDDAEIAAHLGEVLWMSGDRAGARAVWKKARKSEPDDATLLETIKRLGH